MEVLLLTTLFSVAFAVLFLSFFLRERQVREFGGIERDALMPLDDGDESIAGSPEMESIEKSRLSEIPSPSNEDISPEKVPQPKLRA